MVTTKNTSKNMHTRRNGKRVKSYITNSDKPKSRIQILGKKRLKNQVRKYKYSLFNDYLMHPSGLNSPVNL